MKIGILGGGQLGRMLLQAGANYPVDVYVMENAVDCPAAQLSPNFVKGDITDADAVFEFGKDLDAVTIEIESVSVEGVRRLSEHGVKTFPSPEALEIIRNKAVQKEFYRDKSIPTSQFVITSSKEEVKSYGDFFPAVHKAATGGYDGRGVQVLNDIKDWNLAFDGEAVLEKKVQIDKEVAVIVAINEKGETAIYPPSEMVFDHSLNLLKYQISPAIVPEKQRWRLEAIALAVVKGLNSPGIFAIEFFIDNEAEIWVNETAPRVHNSGHDTIEGNYSSQFDMLWRVMLGLPLGNTEKIRGTALVNLVGVNHENINAQSTALQDILRIENAFVHLYGKKESRPGRKMGHVTIVSDDRLDLVHQAKKIRKLWEGED